MYIHEEAAPLQKALVTNSVAASYPNLVATLTEPVGITPATPNGTDGVFTIATIPGAYVSQALFVMPYLQGANNDTFSVRVNGWQKTAGGLWVPAILCEYDYTGGNDANCIGVAGGDVGPGERFADTVSLVANMGTDAQNTFKVSPANDTPAHFIVFLRGSLKVQFQFKKGAGTSGNALFRGF